MSSMYTFTQEFKDPFLNNFDRGGPEMNVREKMLKRLVALGLSEVEAAEVFRLYEESDTGKAAKDRFNEDANVFPCVLFDPLMKDLRDVGRDWMDKNAPNHDAYGGFHTFILA